MTKTAFIMIAGKPNVGKSTLLNTLLGEKIAIVSRKPQTTRNRITGVLTKGENQYVFTDTPGLHKPKTLLGEYMMKSVGNVADSSDIVLFVVEAGTELNSNEVSALDKYSASGMEVILVINKTDRANKIKLAEQIMELSNRYSFRAVIPVSALSGDGVQYILDELDPIETFYYLDVSSPGVERELRTAEHISRSIGERVEAKLFAQKDGRKSIIGTLSAFQDGKITITEGENAIVLTQSEVSKLQTIYFED
jgi:small GTP-binding protein